ncbi:hypothetical protein DFJ74DRAFT_649987 [Hyaloraphidium curvatum]|nr:hypothetical protein DFJ74DRAFT_649987 [Hyaloraphidium curvatum]
MQLLSRTPAALAAAALMAAALLAAPARAQPYVPPPPVPAPPQVPGVTVVDPALRHEVWVLDQSDTGRVNSTALPSFGGRIYIYDGEHLRTNVVNASVYEVIELAGLTTTLCLSKTNARPVRPHMAATTKNGSHIIVSFVTSGHVVIFDAPTRTPVACFRTEVGDQGRIQAHASVLTPDEKWIIVANQNGKKLERISANFGTNTFAQDPAATIDLVNGLTPNGFPRQGALRPDNAPICGFVPSSGYPAFVSLRGGGMLAVDPYTTPMSIVAEYDNATIAGDGCGFGESSGYVWGNGGNNANKPNGWFIYRLPVAGNETYKASNPPNTPAIQKIDQDLGSGPRDSHGGAPVGFGNFFWYFDRVAHVTEVYNASTGLKANTFNLVSPFSDDPAVDIADVSPDGRFLYVATRGPRPLSNAHAAVGNRPGVMVIEILEGGLTGAVRGIRDINNLVTEGNGTAVERGDPHGLIVRRNPRVLVTNTTVTTTATATATVVVTSTATKVVTSTKFQPKTVTVSKFAKSVTKVVTQTKSTTKFVTKRFTKTIKTTKVVKVTVTATKTVKG